MLWRVSLALCLLAGSASGDTQVAQEGNIGQCRALVNGTEVVVDFDPTHSEITHREQVLSWPGRLWNYAWGTPSQCSSDVLIQYLSANVEADDIADYCLAQNEDDSFLLVPGERNFRGRCRKTTCEMVNSTKEEGIALAGSLAGVVTGTYAGLTAGGVTVVEHSSGALIATGSGGYIAGTIGTAATSIASALTAPAVVATAVVSVVAVGGAVFVCSE
jgi:hypothetical protein